MAQEFDDLILAFVEDAVEQLGSVEQVLLALDDIVEDRERINAEPLDTSLRPFHTVKGNAGMLGFMTLSGAVHAIEEFVKDILKAGLIGRSEIDTLFTVLVELRTALRDIGDTLEEPEGIDVEVQKLIEACQSSVVEVSAANSVDTETNQDPNAAAEKKVEITAQKTDSLRIRGERIDAVLTELGELGIYLNGLHRWMNQQFSTLDRETRYEGFALLDRVRTTFLRGQERAVHLRMVPLEMLFGQVPKWVRDLSRSMGKSVRTSTSGAELLLDKNIVDRLQEPFIHLIRNAIDHGFETTEERALTGKDSKGTIFVEAVAQAGALVIRVSDDGRGLSRTRIIEKAREAGIIAADEEPEDWEDLIFRKGFSTKQAVTEVSGRGVGMDIVREAIQGLDGMISVESTEGMGTVFEIHLPLTLAVTDILRVRIGDQMVGIPLRDIAETDAYSGERAEQIEDQSMYRVGDDILAPLYDLRRLYPALSDHDAERYVVRIAKAGREVVLVADELEGEDQAVLKPLRDALFDHPLLRSGSIEGDGSVLYVVDTASLADSLGVARREEHL